MTPGASQGVSALLSMNQLINAFDVTVPRMGEDGAEIWAGRLWLCTRLIEIPAAEPYTHTLIEGLIRMASFDLDDPGHLEVVAGGVTMAEAVGAIEVLCDHDQPTQLCEALSSPDPVWEEVALDNLEAGAFEEHFAIRQLTTSLWAA